MKTQAGQVYGPDDVGHVGENERAGGGPVRRADDRGLQPLGRSLRNALLEERAALRAVREALHEGGPPAHSAHERLRDGEVVAQQVELRLRALREENLAWARNSDASPRDLEHVVLRHRRNRIRSQGARAGRRQAASTRR